MQPMQLALGKGLSFLYVYVRLNRPLSFNIDNKLSMDGQFAVALNSLGCFPSFPTNSGRQRMNIRSIQPCREEQP